ncbi:MAG: hypothetical protein AMK75_05695 [Planctomycetes bacterium SM23_65]|nr:MAG: hypothetical protein AMK75_05695 [Planctomycetes bacterium SM23_65]
MKRLVAAGIAGVAVFVCSAAPAQDAPKPERKRIELTEPGLYTESDCTYVMTRDVTTKGNGFAFTGKNIVVDLGGHTLTFNTEPYRPKFEPGDNALKKYLFTPPFGVCFKRGAENAELRNGRIIQGAGKDKNAKCVFVRAKNPHIHHTTTVISGGDMGRNFFSLWGPDGVRLHHNYIVNHGVGESGWYGAVSFNEVGVNCDIHHNTVVGGHQGILLSSRREKPNAHIHHNYIQHKRTRGAKAPQGIYVRASGCEIDHNEIVTIDGRGLEPTGGDNHWHHNIVDVRYTSTAKGGFYPENRCYGLWARDKGCNGNRITDNLFVVHNEVMGDDTSNAIGLLLCTSPGNPPQLNNVTVSGNRIFVWHDDKRRPAWGLSLRNTGDQVVIRDNFIWAQTAGIEIDDRTRGSRIEGNTFVKTNDKWLEKVAAYRAKGTGLKSCVFRDNKVIEPPQTPGLPAPPTGLNIVRRINGFELHWSANPHPDVLGYVVYRDGKRVEDRLKCGRFYVDVLDPADMDRIYRYSVSASGTRYRRRT